MTEPIALTFAVLAVTVFLMVTDLLRTDIIAIIVMILLPVTGVIDVSAAFSGFASEAVIAVIGVMLIGYGIDRSGMMRTFSNTMVRLTENKPNRLLPLITSCVGLISSFMQNIGAAALFLPAIRRISAKTSIHPKKLFMPIGFAAILGGTITMVASGPLIVLNDLLHRAEHDRYHLFAVTPLGLVLLFAGVGFLTIFADKLFGSQPIEQNESYRQLIMRIYNLPDSIFELSIDDQSPLVGKTMEEVNFWKPYKINILALCEQDSIVYAPWRHTRFASHQVFAVIGNQSDVKRFAKDYHLRMEHRLQVFEKILHEDEVGFAEVIIPPHSEFIGKTLPEVAMRKNFNVEPLAYMSPEGKIIDCFEMPFLSGQQLIVFGRWSDIGSMKRTRDLVVITDVKDTTEGLPKHRSTLAGISLLPVLVLIFLGVPLSFSFFLGATLMIITGVIPKQEIYQAIDWKTVFLLAGLIPLGLAFDQSGAAGWTADMMVTGIGGAPAFVVLLAFGLLTTLLSLFMSNVAATVLLVPLVLAGAPAFSIDPRGMALFIAVCASNSFVLPTHQVNAFFMTPGGYKNRDYIVAGGWMTVIFLAVASIVTYFFYI